MTNIIQNIIFFIVSTVFLFYLRKKQYSLAEINKRLSEKNVFTALFLFFGFLLYIFFLFWVIGNEYNEFWKESNSIYGYHAIFLFIGWPILYISLGVYSRLINPRTAPLAWWLGWLIFSGFFFVYLFLVLFNYIQPIIFLDILLLNLSLLLIIYLFTTYLPLFYYLILSFLFINVLLSFFDPSRTFFREIFSLIGINFHSWYSVFVGVSILIGLTKHFRTKKR